MDKERYGKLDKPGEFGAEGFEVNIEIFFGKHGKVKIGGEYGMVEEAEQVNFFTFPGEFVSKLEDYFSVFEVGGIKEDADIRRFVVLNLTVGASLVAQQTAQGALLEGMAELAEYLHDMGGALLLFFA